MKTKIFTSKKISSICLILLSCFLSFTSIAQENSPKRGEKIKQLKVAYITEQLNLTVAESEKFWPVYNEMELKLKNKRKENKKVIEDLSNNVETYTDEDFKKNVNKIFDNDIAETNIRKDYYTKIAGAIGYKKATKLLKVEKEFKQKLLKELKKRRDEKGGPRK